LEVALFPEVLQADYHNEACNGSRTHSIKHCWAEAKWLLELLMNLLVAEKLIPAISMNCDNQTMIIKVNSSRNNMKSTRHVKRRLKFVRKLKTLEL